MKSIPVGILHTTSGPMAKHGQAMVDAVLMAIDEINHQGGILGMRLEPVVAQCGTEPKSFIKGAHYLLKQVGVTQVFGAWTSDARRAVSPLFAEFNALLWYPLRYEGVEVSRNIFYGGACPNQQIEPAIDWFLSQGKRSFYLLGSDSVYSRLTHKVVSAQLKRHGSKVLGESYVALGQSNFETAIADIQRLQPDLVVNTITAADLVPFYRAYAAAGLTAAQIPMISSSMTEVDLAMLGPLASGHYAAWSYFHGLKTQASKSFTTRFQARYGHDRKVSDPTATAYSQVFLWKQAVESAESFETDDIRVAAYGEEFASPWGPLSININHHASRPCFIGQANDTGTFEIIHQPTQPIEPLPWLGLETVDFSNSSVVKEMLGQVSSNMQQNWKLEQKSAELEQVANQLAEEVLERHRAEEESRLLVEINQTMTEAIDIETAMYSAISHVCRVTCWPYGEVWMPSEDNKKLLSTDIWCLDETLVTAGQKRQLEELHRLNQTQSYDRNQGLLGQVWVQAEARWNQAADNHSTVAIPILAAQPLQHPTDHPPTKAWHSNPSQPDRPESTEMKGQSTESLHSDRVLAVLLFVVPECRAKVRTEESRLVRLVSAVAAQLGGAVQQKQVERLLRQKNEELIQTLGKLKEAQEELVQSEKMVALGQLVAGIAHEINTPLGAICSSAEYLDDFLDRDLLELPGFFQSLSPVKRQFFGKLLQEATQRPSLLSSRERRKQRRAIVKSLTALGIDQADSFSDELISIRPDWDLEALLPLLQEPRSLEFMQYIGRLLELRNSSQEITIAAERASKVVFALKTYAHYDHEGELRQANMEESLETILTLYQNKFKHGIAIERNYSHIPSLFCYPDELNQVWMNLVHNAIQAMDEQGTLTVSTTQTEDWIHISIEDSGCGIPESVQQRMFEPFFTTKSSGEGSGLGLDIVQKIVCKHGGNISVESEPGCTCFTVSLPLVAAGDSPHWKSSSQPPEPIFKARPPRPVADRSSSRDVVVSTDLEKQTA